jgi:RNA recognition motif-containing protein
MAVCRFFIVQGLRVDVQPPPLLMQSVPHAQHAWRRATSSHAMQSWDTNDTRLRTYFENFGMVKEAFVSYDRETGKPRGFGFVVFENPTVAERVVQNKHTIDRREVCAVSAVGVHRGVPVRSKSFAIFSVRRSMPSTRCHEQSPLVYDHHLGTMIWLTASRCARSLWAGCRRA